MRRFFVWSALAAVIGLAIAIGGFWAYQHFWARFQPVTITREQAAIQRLLDESSWISTGGGGEPLYIVGYRDSAAMQRYEREEAPKLRAGGIEPRVIVFARADREGQAQSTAAERATIAELWLTRDWSLYQRWTATPARNWTAAGLPAADGNLARSAVVEASREFASRLGEAMASNGLQVRYPLVVWRDREGFLKACACSDSRSWAFIRDDLGAPDRVAPAAAPGEGVQGPAPMVYPGDGSPESLPYPTLPAPPADGVPPATTPPPAASTGPRASPAPTPPRPRPAPKPTKQDDTTFF
jgi:hypothetical protein